MSDKGGAIRSVERKTRQHERKRVEFPVTIVDAENRTSGGLSFDAADLSMGGVFLRSSVLFELDEELGIEFQLGGALVKARARVVRISTDERAGMGIAFSRIDPAHREALQAFLAASA